MNLSDAIDNLVDRIEAGPLVLVTVAGLVAWVTWETGDLLVGLFGALVLGFPASFAVVLAVFGALFLARFLAAMLDR